MCISETSEQAKAHLPDSMVEVTILLGKVESEEWIREERGMGSREDV